VTSNWNHAPTTADGSSSAGTSSGVTWRSIAAPPTHSVRSTIASRRSPRAGVAAATVAQFVNASPIVPSPEPTV
jgi:hypothetical protein